LAEVSFLRKKDIFAYCHKDYARHVCTARTLCFVFAEFEGFRLATTSSCGYQK
jgi:hypothetical protein